jgi:DNA-binding CsgD family transcriptional regulator
MRQPGRTSVLANRVVGRDRELVTLRTLLGATKERRGGVSFLVGEAGIGKSRLALLTAADAEGAGMAVLRGRAVRTVTPVAYRPLAEALCSAVRVGGGPDSPELAPFRATLGRLIPDWHAEGHGRVDHSVVALAEAVLRFLRAVAGGRGCLLVLEDLHWADPETLTILEYLADNLTSEAVLCLGTLRPEDRSGAHYLARSLEARRVSEVIQLSRLDDQDVAQMVRSCLDADAVAPQVLALAGRAEGVPFLVEELLAVAVASGSLVREGGSWVLSTAWEPVVPFTFADSMRRRVATLGHEVRTVLVAAAILGRRFDWDLLPAITGLGESDVLAALHVAVDAQIVSVNPGQTTFRFRHALTRDAVLAELLPPERAAWSRRALGAVDAAQPDLPGEWCELGAELAEAAGDRGRAASLLLESALRALRHGALVSAEVTLDRARSLSPPDDSLILDVEERLVNVVSLAGKRDRTIEVGRSLLARLGEDPREARRRAEVHLRLARAAVAATRWDEAHELCEQARAEARAATDDRLMAWVDAVSAQTAIMREPERAPRLAQAALEAAERLDLPEVACEALEILGRSQRAHGAHDLRGAEDAFARALAVADAHGLAVWRARALHELGTIDLLRGAGVTRLEEARELALAQGALATAAVVDLQIGAVLAFRDDPEPAVVPARRAAELARRYGLDQTLAAAVGREAHVHARAGRRDLTERCIQEALAHAPGAPDIEAQMSLAAAILAFVEEDRASARRHLHRAVAPASASGLPGGDHSSGPAGGVWALVREVDGEAGEAPGSEPARGSMHFMGRGYLHYAQSVAAGRAGDNDGATAMMTEGDRVLGDHEWLRQLGRRLVAEAALADGWGDPVAWLREALGFFDQRGEERIASACRSLLRKAGAPVPRRRGEEATPAALRGLGITARESEVLGLLADGLSNKEIAARLYLSPRTVERHVANLAAKAGVERRSQLVAFAARTAADPRSS